MYTSKRTVVDSAVVASYNLHYQKLAVWIFFTKARAHFLMQIIHLTTTTTFTGPQPSHYPCPWLSTRRSYTYSYWSKGFRLQQYDFDSVTTLFLKLKQATKISRSLKLESPSKVLPIEPSVPCSNCQLKDSIKLTSVSILTTLTKSNKDKTFKTHTTRDWNDHDS
jgi:hypothetical protein